MRSFFYLALMAGIPTSAQYGAFDPAVLKVASAKGTLVVLDDANTSYNGAVTNAMKAEWKFSSELDFMNARDLATQPIDPAKNYLMKITRSDKEKHDATFIALITGWKQKKGESLVVENGAVTNIPPAQELASIMIDANAVNSTNSAMVLVYVKHLQDYLNHVLKGDITDKATADRFYQRRTHVIKDMDLLITQEQLDKTVPDAAKAGETYRHPLRILTQDEVIQHVETGKSVAVADVVLTGSEKTRWCFKRVFNANTGELMFLRDDAALYDKKLGFITEDLRMMEQSR